MIIDDDQDDDTCSEGAQQAIDTSRVAAETEMVVVHDQEAQKTITLCDSFTQTDSPVLTSCGVMAKPPTPPPVFDCAAQATVQQTEAAT